MTLTLFMNYGIYVFTCDCMSSWTATDDGIIVYDGRAENPESDYDDPTLDNMDAEGVQEAPDFNADSDDNEENPDNDEYETNPTTTYETNKRKIDDRRNCLIQSLLLRLQNCI